MSILIKSKARESIGLGRFVLHIDDFEKLVRIEVLEGPSPNAQERRNIEKYLKYKRPDIIRDEIITGWGIQGAIDLGA